MGTLEEHVVVAAESPNRKMPSNPTFSSFYFYLNQPTNLTNSYCQMVPRPPTLVTWTQPISVQFDAPFGSARF